MINYNPKEWFGLIFQFHKTDTFTKLLRVMVGIGLFTLLIAFFEDRYDFFSRSTTAVHSLLGFVISLLLVFRTNTAYDRWWEGRKQWGALVNISRNLAIKMNAIIPIDGKGERDYWISLISGYSYALKEHLRGRSSDSIIEGLDEGLRELIRDKEHIPNAIASLMQAQVMSMFRQKQITSEQIITFQQNLDIFTDITGACERIKRTPIPYIYSLFIKKFIFIYTITMPFGFVNDFAYLTIPMVIFVFYAMASLEVIAEEIEDPFGRDANDLPTDDLVVNIRKHVGEILKAQE